MAHLTSYAANAAVGVLRHDERSPGDSVASRKNECIVPSRTKFNYNLAPARSGKLQEHIKAICTKHEIRLNSRKDLNVMSSWIITKPKDIAEAEQEEFFKATYDFLCNRYGAESVLTATVHLDETTPHLHFGFIPVGVDKNGAKTVSSKLVCTRAELRAFHKDLSKYLEQRFGRKIAIENGATAKGNKAIEELKRQSAEETLRKTHENASKIVSEAKGKVTTLTEQKKALESKIEALESDLLTRQQINALDNKKTIGGKVKISVSDFEKLQITAQKAESLQSQLDKMADELSAAERILNSVKKEKIRLFSENCNLESELSDTKEELQALSSAIAKMPDKIRKVILQLATDTNSNGNKNSR